MNPIRAIINRFQPTASYNSHDAQAHAAFTQSVLLDRTPSPKQKFLKSIGATYIERSNAYDLLWMKEVEVRFRNSQIIDNKTSADARLELAWIKTYKHKQGTGSACLKWILEKADAAGLSLHTFDYPTANDMSPAKLRRWYKRFDFVVNPDDPTGATLIRPANPTKTPKQQFLEAFQAATDEYSDHNQGYNIISGRWNSAQGDADFVLSEKSEGVLNTPNDDSLYLWRIEAHQKNAAASGLRFMFKLADETGMKIYSEPYLHSGTTQDRERFIKLVTRVGFEPLTGHSINSGAMVRHPQTPAA